MIPLGSQISDANLEEVVEPSKTYYIDFLNGRIMGDVDGIDSVRQAITKILITNRYEHDIYNPNYASELQRLAGKDLIYVKSEIRRIVTESLLTDDRISRVDNFVFKENKNNLDVSFLVQTIFGNIESGVQLNV